MLQVAWAALDRVGRASGSSYSASTAEHRCASGARWFALAAAPVAVATPRLPLQVLADIACISDPQQAARLRLAGANWQAGQQLAKDVVHCHVGASSDQQGQGRLCEAPALLCPLAEQDQQQVGNGVRLCGGRQAQVGN